MFCLGTDSSRRAATSLGPPALSKTEFLDQGLDKVLNCVFIR